MQTCNVTHFKNHALGILAHIAESGEELTVTRHGKKLARISPVREAPRVQLGKLQGTVAFNGDIVGPLGDEDWHACK
jgi:antitoxin (DNA-binding transcriptional repressor) of toxin-antitoxin stability system